MKFYWQYPTVNDVTTTPENGPVFVTLARRKPDVFRQKVKLQFGDNLEPLTINEDADEVFLAVEKMAEEMRWVVMYCSRAERELEAIASSKTLRFKDDIRVEVRGDNPSVVHVRSRSRLGRKDFGVNEHRIRKFLEKVSQSLS